MKRSQNILLIILLSCAFSTGLGSADIVIDNSKTTDAVMRGGAYADLLQEDAGSEWTPADLPDIVDWWRADDVAGNITKDGSGYVSSWKGSINSIDLAQATYTRQPQWLDAQLNGYPAIVFDGEAPPVGDYLEGAFDSTYTQPTTIIIVCSEPTDNGTPRFIFDGYGGGRQVLVQKGDLNIYRIMAQYWRNTTYGIGAGFKIFSCVFNRASSVFRVNGNDYSPSGDVGPNPISGITIAAFANLYHANISVTDIIPCSSGLSVENLALAEAYFATKYGL